MSLSITDLYGANCALMHCSSCFFATWQFSWHESKFQITE